jgi:hypothetical protein
MTLIQTKSSLHSSFFTFVYIFSNIDRRVPARLNLCSLKYFSIEFRSLGIEAASVGNGITTFRDNLMSLSSKVEMSKNNTGDRLLRHSCVIPGSRRDVDDICALLGCYATLSVSYVQTFRDNLSGIIFRVQEILQPNAA